MVPTLKTALHQALWWVGVGLALGVPTMPRAGTLAAADEGLQAKVKAAYIHHFLSFVEWPSLEGIPEGEPFRVGVLGKDAVATLLKDGLSGRKAQGRILQVEAVASGNPSTFRGHLLYIARSEADRMPQLVQHLPRAGVLVVSDIEGFAGRGGMAGFGMEEGRVRVELNLPALRQSGLKVSSRLLEVSRLIQGGGR